MCGMSEKIVKFDEYAIDFGRFQLLCRDLSAVKMEGRPMQLLMLLVEQSGELITREEITDYCGQRRLRRR